MLKALAVKRTLGEMQTENASPFRRLREVLAPERADIWVILTYVTAVGCLALVVPVATQALVNTAGFGTLVQPLLVLALLVLIVLSAAGLLRVLQVVVAERLQQRIFARMAIDVAHRLPQVRLESYDTIRGTEFVNRFFDVLTIQKSTALILLDAAAIVLQTAIGMVLLALYHPLLLGFAVLLFAAMLFVLFGLGRGAVRSSVDESYAKYDVVAWLEEIARIPLAFRMSGGAELAFRRADAATVDYLTKRQSHFRILRRQIIGTVAIQALASALLLGLGGLLVAREQLTLGQLVAAEIIVTPAVAGFARSGKYLETLYELLAGVEKVSHLFELPLGSSAGEALPDDGAALQVELREVSLLRFGRATLDRVHIEVAAGERLAILGPRGSGKSVLAEVIAGQRAPSQGTVKLHGIDLREVHAQSLRERVALVRGGDLFDGSLRENLGLNREQASPQAVSDLLSRLGLQEDLDRLPEGLQTDVGGNLNVLTIEQSLRLALARAVLGRPKLLVVDETLDPLEPNACSRALAVLLAPDAPWTLILTTRLPEVASRFERVVRFERGRAIAERDALQPS